MGWREDVHTGRGVHYLTYPTTFGVNISFRIKQQSSSCYITTSRSSQQFPILYAESMRVWVCVECSEYAIGILYSQYSHMIITCTRVAIGRVVTLHVGMCRVCWVSSTSPRRYCQTRTNSYCTSLQVTYGDPKDPPDKYTSYITSIGITPDTADQSNVSLSTNVGFSHIADAHYNALHTQD